MVKDILISGYMFICPCCGAAVRRGDSYVVYKCGTTVCIKCGLPARRLRPLHAESKSLK